MELALEELEGEIAAELPAHVRALARGGTAPAPEAARRAASIEVAQHAAEIPALAGRGRALLRLLAPIAIEDDAEVARARAAPRTWRGYERLAAARDVAARRGFGEPHLAVLHRLYGAGAPSVFEGGPRRSTAGMWVTSSRSARSTR